MDKVFFAAAMLMMAGVIGSLLWGLAAMARGAEKDRKTSNKMMRMRVLFQGLAILFLFLAYLGKR